MSAAALEKRQNTLTTEAAEMRARRARRVEQREAAQVRLTELEDRRGIALATTDPTEKEMAATRRQIMECRIEIEECDAAVSIADERCAVIDRELAVITQQLTAHAAVVHLDDLTARARQLDEAWAPVLHALALFFETVRDVEALAKFLGQQPHAATDDDLFGVLTSRLARHLKIHRSTRYAETAEGFVSERWDRTRGQLEAAAKGENA